MMKNILVTPTPPIITTHPVSAAISIGQDSSFKVVATGSELIYQWEVSQDGGISFSKISDGGVYRGSTTEKLILKNVPASMNGYQYQVIISNSANAITSNPATLITSLKSPTVIGANSCGPGTVTLTARGAPVGGSYRWYTTPTITTAIADASENTYATPFLTTSTTYYVSILIGNNESSRTPVTATISPLNFTYGGLKNEVFKDIIQTKDGGYLFGGHSGSPISGDKGQESRGLEDFWIVKTDASGNWQWDKRYGGAHNDFMYSVIQTADGGYLLGGASLSGAEGDKSQVSQGTRDFWVVKISNSGVKQWDKSFGGKGYDKLIKMIQLPTGEYILAGFSNSPANGDKSQSSRGGFDYWVIKMSKAGEKIWDKRYGGSLDETLEGLAPTMDGGFLLGGSSASGIGGDKTQASWGGTDYWVVRINSNGVKVWDKRFGGSGNDNLMALGSTGTSTGNFFIAGYSTSGIDGDKSQASQGGKDYWMLKVNSSGTKIWDKRFGGSSEDELGSIIMAADGGYLLSGRSISSKSGDKSQVSFGNYDYWALKLSSTGIKQWDRSYGGSGAEELRTSIQSKDGSFMLAGMSNSGLNGVKCQPSKGGVDFWLVKIEPDTKPIVATREANGIEEPVTPAELSTLKAYPNPFQDKVNINFTLPKTQLATIKVYDAQGREAVTLFQGEVKANQTYQVEWKAGNNATGMYLLQLQTPTEQNTQKLLLSK